MQKRTKKPWPSDRQLVEDILGGNRESFDLLYECYLPRVYRFALKRLRDPGEAEDVAQDVFITLLSALESYKGESSLLVWIFGITRNTVNRRFRKPRPRLESLDEEGGLLGLHRRSARRRLAWGGRVRPAYPPGASRDITGRRVGLTRQAFFSGLLRPVSVATLGSLAVLVLVGWTQWSDKRGA